MFNIEDYQPISGTWSDNVVVPNRPIYHISYPWNQIATTVPVVQYGIGILIVLDGKFLTTVRKAGCGTGIGVTAMPGGRFKFGEDIFLTAVTKAVEETGLVILPFQVKGEENLIFHTEVVIDRSEHHVNSFVAATVVGGELRTRQPEKNEPWHWSSIEEFEGQEGHHWVPFGYLDKHRCELFLD